MLEPLPLIELSPPELLLVVAVLSLAVARWLPARFRGGVRIAGIVLAVPGVVGAAACESRWQLLPVLAALALLLLPRALLALIAAVRAGQADLSEPRLAIAGLSSDKSASPGWVAVVGTVVCCGLALGGVVAAVLLPVPRFPEPSGPHPVGTTVLQWSDPGRPEPATAAAGDHRSVVAQLWYPAQPSSADRPRALHLGRTAAEAELVARAQAGYIGLPGFLLDGAARGRSHSVPDAEPADGRFPVVLFSPGLGAVRTMNTGWAEELASRGYLVAALDHPYDSAAVQLTDGRVIRTRVSATGDDTEDERRAAGWTEVRAADLSFVRARLADLAHGSPGSLLAGRIDPDRVAVAGHSLGGAAALLAARRDPTFDAVIDLDGYPRDPSGAPYRQPVLALRHQPGGDESADYAERLTATLRQSRATGYLIMVPGTAHLTFTDAPLFLPPLPGLVGSLGRTGGLTITAEASADFLDATLIGDSTDPAGRGPLRRAPGDQLTDRRASEGVFAIGATFQARMVPQT